MFTKQKALSLVELIITITIVAIVATISVVLLQNTLKSTKRVQAQVFLYTEAQAIMDDLARNVEVSAIDYEAYYARKVLAQTWETPDYGYYAQSFYNPGTDGPNDGPYSFGGYDAFCADGVSTYPDDCPDESPVYSELDLDTGAHPFPGISSIDSSYSATPSYMNAICETKSTPPNCAGLKWHIVDELLLINTAGDERTVFLRECNDSSCHDRRISFVRMLGTDSDTDGVVDTWACEDDFTCTETGAEGQSIPSLGDLNNDDLASDFIPLTPDTIDIESFYVFIAPNEDPYRAFSERAAQVQPQVTIVMTVTLSDRAVAGIVGDPPSITIQRTVSTGVYSEIISYE